MKVNLTPATIVLLSILAVGGCFGGSRSEAPELADTACTDSEQGASPDCAGGPRLSPFICLRFTEACDVEVQLEENGSWYRWLGLDGVSTAALIETAKNKCGEIDWKKRIAEDLPAIAEAHCVDLFEPVGIQTVEVSGGQYRVFENVLATEGNRAAAKSCWPELDRCVVNVENADSADAAATAKPDAEPQADEPSAVSGQVPETN